MTNETKHTPTPWHTYKCPCKHPSCDAWFFGVQGANGAFGKDDFDYAVKAIHAHDELVEIVERYALPCAHQNKWDDVVKKILEALAKAGAS